MDVKIGLEIHAPLKTERKLFCDCPTDYHDTTEPNSLVCEICTAMPGIKPKPVNKRALESVIIISKLLNCKLPTEKIFLKRKHYNYPDLPKGYQITSEPIGKDGKFSFEDGSFPDVGIWEAHLEEDPGQFNLTKGQVDYNRSGVPLVEIVTAPDLKSSEHARAFMKELVSMLEYSELILEGDGIIRADVNVSIKGGPRREIKNVNSIRSIARAIEYEISAQDEIVNSGGLVEQETRGWDDEKGETYLMRKKENAEDYRYIPDPDLPPIMLDEALLDALGEGPETPQDMRARFKETYGISGKYAKVITNDKEVALFFEEALKLKETDPELCAKWMAEEVLAQLNYKEKTLSETKLSVPLFVELMELLRKDAITDSIAKKLLERIMDSGESPVKIVTDEGLAVVKDESALKAAVKSVIEKNKKAVEDYNSGNLGALNFLMGQVMREMKGRARAGEIISLLKEELD